MSIMGDDQFIKQFYQFGSFFIKFGGIYLMEIHIDRRGEFFAM
jgi:hypothetical protein